jgi:FtsH ternary system domain X5
MSRAYRVSWVNVTGSVTTSDTLTMGVSLLPILPPSAMSALLRDELAKEGWTRSADGSMHKTVEGLPATLDPDAAKVTIKASAEGEVKERGVNKQDAEENLVRGKQAREQALKDDLRKALTSAESVARKELGDATQRAYLTALKQKAASMGQVESVLEGTSGDGSGDYEVTIKVRV